MQWTLLFVSVMEMKVLQVISIDLVAILAFDAFKIRSA